MKALPEFRDRDDVEVAVLDALVARADEGMTVFELRADVEADIDRLETALENLKNDNLIDVEGDGETVRIRPAERVVPDPEGAVPEDKTVFDVVREKLGL